MDIQQAIETAVKKTEINIKTIGPNLKEFPAQPDGIYFKVEGRELSHIFNWTQSFFTGMAYWAYKITKDENFLRWMYGFYDEYYKKSESFETMHDLGFLYTPYALAVYRTNGDPNMKKIGVKAADELAKRFNPAGGYIRAWGRMDGSIPSYVDKELARDHFFAQSNGLAIIDCMMNLPLLFWASEVTGHPYYKRIAMRHADTTIKYFIRNDYSVCHAYRFNELTGEPVGVENYCGYDKNSHWARGTAWAIYGYAIAYDYTKKKEYLDVAVKLTEKFIHLCEDDGIPVWDFCLPPDKPAMYCGIKHKWMNWDITDPQNIKYNRDTSAAAIAVCGIYEILKHIPNDVLSSAADKMLNSLVEKYMDTSLNTSGLLKNQNGNMTYTCFGDYYLMEALIVKEYGYERIW